MQLIVGSLMVQMSSSHHQFGLTKLLGSLAVIAVWFAVLRFDGSIGIATACICSGLTVFLVLQLPIHWPVAIGYFWGVCSIAMLFIDIYSRMFSVVWWAIPLGFFPGMWLSIQGLRPEQTQDRWMTWLAIVLNIAPIVLAVLLTMAQLVFPPLPGPLNFVGP